MGCCFLTKMLAGFEDTQADGLVARVAIVIPQQWKVAGGGAGLYEVAVPSQEVTSVGRYSGYAMWVVQVQLTFPCKQPRVPINYH